MAGGGACAPSGTGAFATGATRTSTSSTSGIPSNSARTSSTERAVASSADTRAPPFFCISAPGCGSISSNVPAAFSLRCTIRARAPGAWQDFASEKATSSLGSEGSATGFCAGFGAGGATASSGSALEALERRSTRAPDFSTSGAGVRSAPEARRTSWTSASVACSSRSTCMRSGLRRCAFSLPINVSATWAISTMVGRPMVAALPLTECTRRKIESQSGPPGGSCSIRTSSEASSSRCSIASAMKACKYLWGASAMGPTRRAPSSPPPGRPRRGRA